MKTVWQHLRVALVVVLSLGFVGVASATYTDYRAVITDWANRTNRTAFSSAVISANTQMLAAPAVATNAWDLNHLSCTTATAAEEQILVKTGTGVACATGTATIQTWNIGQDGGGFVVANFSPPWPVAVGQAVCISTTSAAHCNIIGTIVTP